MSSSYIKIKVLCEHCGRLVEIDWSNAPIDSMTVRFGELAPHLRNILADHETPQLPPQPPTKIPNCPDCRKPEKQPVEGSTFRKKQYRGKLKTIGKRNNKFGKSCEYDADRDRDYHDDQILSAGYYKTRYGADREDANKQSEIREWVNDSQRLQDAEKVLDGLSVRDIQKNWGIDKSTAQVAKSRIKSKIKK